MKRHLLPLIIIASIWAMIVIHNSTPGIWLTGWDNLHPEFDFFLNIKRSLFGVWQEYQGLGLLGGMGHIAALPREIILWMFSLVLPESFLRYIWTFLMLLVGPLGVYALTHFLLKKNSDSGYALRTLLPSLGAAIFYLFNLNTAQTFVTPYEAFITHYGALPWFFWGAIRILQSPTRKNIVLFSLINILGMTQAYVPTLFLVYLISLILVIFIAMVRNLTKTTTRAVGLLLGITICINAIWALPFTYFTLTNASVVVNSKINQMATQEIFLRNQKYGTLIDTLQLKNFWFDSITLDSTKHVYVQMFDGWQIVTQSWLYKFTSIGIIAIVIIGWILSFRDRTFRAWGIVGVVSFIMIAVDTAPFSQIVSYLRQNVPLLSQFFRFPFTKWGTTLSLMYALSFALTLYTLMGLLAKKYSHVVIMVIVASLTLLPILAHFPILSLPLISPFMKRNIPEEYFSLYAYMKNNSPGRIAYLPMESYWDWKYYRWGYFGSGFLWYGMENPILDQAFNSWNRYNENYYWELSRALYSKNSTAVDSVLTKYDVRYILLDENIVSAENNRSLYIDEINEIFTKLPSIKELQRFGKLTVYERLGSDSQSFVSVKSDLPTVSPSYRWTDNDVAYVEIGDYIAENDGFRVKPGMTDNLYPFRSLFTKRSIDEREFTVEETEASLILKPLADLPSTSSAVIEKFTSLQFTSDSNPVLRAQDVQPCSILRDGEATAQNFDQALRFTSRNQRGCLSFSAGNLPHADGYLVAVESRHISGRPLLFSLINQTAKHVELETYLDQSKVESQKSKVNDSEWKTNYFVLPPLASDGLGYTAYLSNDAIGRQETINDIRSIKFYRIPYTELVTLRSGQPQGTFDELSVNLALSVEKVDHPNPAYYRIGLTTQDVGRTENQTLVLSQSFDPGWTAWERISTFPYVRQLNDHVLVNNWENAWLLEEQPKSADQTKYEPSTNSSEKANTESRRRWNESRTIILFFWPQLLQWIGFVLLPIPLLFLRKR